MHVISMEIYTCIFIILPALNACSNCKVCTYACIIDYILVWVFALVLVMFAKTGCMQGWVEGHRYSKAKAKQWPDWSGGLSKTPGGPLMELSSCYVLAVQQPPLLSHNISITHCTHAPTYCLLVSTTQQFVLSWSQDDREFKDTTAPDRPNICQCGRMQI